MLGEVQAGHQEEFLHRKYVYTWVGDGQGDGGVPTHGDVQRMAGQAIGCGTQCSGDKVGIGI